MSINRSFEQAIISMETEAPQDFYNLDWASISGFRLLSEEFISRYYFRVKWAIICTNQKLSERFITNLLIIHSSLYEKYCNCIFT